MSAPWRTSGGRDANLARRERIDKFDSPERVCRTARGHPVDQSSCQSAGRYLLNIRETVVGNGSIRAILKRFIRTIDFRGYAVK
jgi:hypothetical protein